MEKLMVERQAFEAQLAILEKQHQIEKDKYADNQARREHKLAQLETKKQHKQISSENAISKTVEKAQAHTTDSK